MAGSAIKRKLKKNGYGNIYDEGELFCPTRKELDLLDINKVYEFFEQKKPSIVIVAAAKVGGILANHENPADFILENLKIQMNVIETSWKLRIKY